MGADSQTYKTMQSDFINVLTQTCDIYIQVPDKNYTGTVSSTFTTPAGDYKDAACLIQQARGQQKQQIATLELDADYLAFLLPTADIKESDKIKFNGKFYFVKYVHNDMYLDFIHHKEAFLKIARSENNA